MAIEVEALPRHRLEERPVADVDLHLVERGVEPGHPERALVDVGRDDGARVGGEVQCLHAAPGAQVQRAADRLTHRQLRQARRCARDAQDVVRADRDRGAVEAGRQVGDDPEVTVPSFLRGGVGAAVGPGRDLADALLQQPGVAEPVDQTGERPLRVVARHRGLQQEEPDQGVDRCPRRRTTQCGEGLVAPERPVRLLADRLGDPVVGEVGGEQGLAQGPGEVEVGRHGPSLADTRRHGSGPPLPEE